MQIRGFSPRSAILRDKARSGTLLILQPEIVRVTRHPPVALPSVRHHSGASRSGPADPQPGTLHHGGTELAIIRVPSIHPSALSRTGRIRSGNQRAQITQ